MKADSTIIKGPGIDSKEFELVKKFIRLVTNFIITGNPNGSNNEFNFLPVANDPFHCLDISNDSFEMFELPEKARMQLWDEVLKDADIPIC
jgi:hypothetical protein